MRLYASGQAAGLNTDGTPERPGFTREELQAVLVAGGKLSLQQALHCRIRYFTDGLVLGSQTYVDDAFERYRDRFSPKRESGARPFNGIDLGDLCTARRLRLNTLALPAM